MPAQQNETLNVVEVVELAIDEEKVVFESESPEIISKIDHTRIITNLVKNAIQSIPEQQENNRICNGKKDSNNK
jgi:hypothetical protein